MSQYIFSYFTTESTSKVIRRPWWDLFGRDTITKEEVWVRKAVHLSLDVADVVIKASRNNWNTPEGKLILSLIPNIKGCQIEHGAMPTSFAPIYSISLGRYLVSIFRGKQNENSPQTRRYN